MGIRIAVLASGRGSNMDSILEHIDAGRIDGQVTLLLSDKPGAPCLEKARAAGVPAVVELPVESGEKRAEYDARLVEVLQAEAPDLVVLAGFMRILTPTFCDAFAGRIINIHPALLPSFKGAHGIRDTLAGGAKLAGCSTHFVTAELDGGPIILQGALAIQPDDDEDRLAARVLPLEHQLLPRTVQLFAEGRIAPVGSIAPGPSWHGQVDPVPGALYPAAF